MTQMSEPNAALADGMDEDLDEGEVPAEVRSRLALALDVDDIVAARRLAVDLEPFFSPDLFSRVSSREFPGISILKAPKASF